MFSFFRRHAKKNSDKGDICRPSSRMETAFFVLENAVNDFFGGWSRDDCHLLEAYRPKSYPKPSGQEIIDWLGIRTNASYHSWLNISDKGMVNAELPIPDDMVHAETIEYVALVTSINNACNRHQNSFTAVELGASYAPWAIAAGVLADRKGFKEINLLAVEASSSMSPKISEHAKLNGLLEGDNIVKLNVVQGAIACNDGVVFFPKVNVSGDNGGQISTVSKVKDYRGLDLDHEEVAAYKLDTLLASYQKVDFLHMDVQGAELELLKNTEFLQTLDQKVSLFFLATQSRLIEGVALEALGSLGWNLLRERPTIFRQNINTKDVNGWTLRDGGQIWINPKLG